MVPEEIWRWAQLKGISVIGTGDFTHTGWMKELTEKLEKEDSGLYSLKKEFRPKDIPDTCKGEVYFLLSSEVSSIYKKHGKTRKVHSLVLVPDISFAKKISNSLSMIGNINSDGRPILGIDTKELYKIVMDICPDALFIPAHAWTPHFSVFGAESGFDSLEECFEEIAPHICAIETGLSSDPPMNRRLSSLDRINLISNSDAHSPLKIGREANIFEGPLSYKNIADAIKTGEGLSGTIEFFPEEGKYHYDGHRLCHVRLSPRETKEKDYRCPVCGRRLTIGVMHRVEKLADRPDSSFPLWAKPYYSVIPLQEIIAETLKNSPSSKAVETEYKRLLNRLGCEFKILLELPLDEIEKEAPSLLKEAISRVRNGRVYITPGFDGEYGKISIFSNEERKSILGQGSLF
ncbi:MAG: endonuclease Q family protein [Syntrophorhabdaceae bacterium]|nr:endonuclease Q family protein [Syntrophorhabdaceae bacterium]